MRERLKSFFVSLIEGTAHMTETCYTKGQKVILVTSQTKTGKWLCAFSIPGFNHLDGGRSDRNSSNGYKTEWEARTNAFQRAKLLLDGPQDITQGPALKRA